MISKGIFLSILILIHAVFSKHLRVDVDNDLVTTIDSTKIYCLWMCNSGWDSDFIQEIFSQPTFQHMSFKNKFMKFHNNTEPNFRPRVIIYNIENGRTDEGHEDLKSMIDRFKPAVLVHISDEFLGDTGRKWRYRLGATLYGMAPLVLRSYSIHPYRNIEYPNSNVMQLPLGYISGMLNINSTHKMTAIEFATFSLTRKTEHRNLSWSFVGNFKGHKDRNHAIEVFNAWDPHVELHDIGVNHTEMRNIYIDSKFVVVGRGQVNLDCFRIYESLICGAIPVVVGSASELQLTFEFEGDVPPFLYAESYESALIIARNMSNVDVDNHRQSLVQWFVDRINLIRRRVNHVTHVF